MKFVFLGLLLICSAFAAPELLHGIDRTFSIEASEEDCPHVLACPGENRSKEVFIQFEEAFEKTPKVIISIAEISQDEGLLDFNVQLGGVSSTGFSYIASVNSNQNIQELHINWLATANSQVAVGYLNNYTDFYKVNGDRNTAVTSENVPIDFTEPLECENGYVSQVFILGGTISSGTQELVLVNLDDWLINIGGGFKVAVQETVLTSISASIISTCVDSGVFQSGEVSTNIDSDSSNIWKNPNNQYRSLNFQGQYSNAQHSNPVVFYGFSRIDATGAQPLNLKVDNLQASTGVVNIDITTWGLTDLDGAGVAYAVFFPTVECAIVYSECNYQGDSLKICPGAPIHSFENNSWSEENRVKSAKVPSGRTLTMFDAENLEGPYVQLTADEDCNEQGWTFDLPQQETEEVGETRAEAVQRLKVQQRL